MADESLGVATPAAPVAPAVDTAPAPDAPVDQAPADSPQEAETEKPPEKTYTETEHRKAIQERLGREQKRLREVERANARAEFAEKQLEELRRPPQQPQPRSGEPKADDPEFGGDFEKYLIGKAKWEFKQEVAAENEAREKRESTQRQQSDFAQRARYVQENLVAKGVAKFGAEFTEVVMGDVPITEVMVAAASRLPTGADVLFNLAKNDPEELHRIAGLPDIEQAWEIKDLAAKLAASPAPTRTPAPIVPNGTKTTVDRDPSKMSDKEFDEWRKRSIAQRRNR